jgi:hypothetical protein
MPLDRRDLLNAAFVGPIGVGVLPGYNSPRSTDTKVPLLRIADAEMKLGPAPMSVDAENARDVNIEQMLQYAGELRLSLQNLWTDWHVLKGEDERQKALYLQLKNEYENSIKNAADTINSEIEAFDKESVSLESENKAIEQEQAENRNLTENFYSDARITGDVGNEEVLGRISGYGTLGVKPSDLGYHGGGLTNGKDVAGFLSSEKLRRDLTIQRSRLANQKETLDAASASAKSKKLAVQARANALNKRKNDASAYAEKRHELVQDLEKRYF